MRALLRSLRTCALFIAIAVALFFAAILAPISTSPAYAEEPQDLDQNFVDLADAIEDDQAVLHAVREVPGTSLYVVIVKDFAALDAPDWATLTAEKSGLQSYDGLIAIATQSKEIGYSPGRSDSSKVSGVVDESVITTAITDDVKDLLHNEQWDEGVMLIAQNVAILADGGSINSPAPFYILLAIAALVVIALIVIVWRAHKKQAKKQEEDLQALSERASSELVRIDDAVRSASQEVAFAQAEFGLEATQGFSAALTKAQKDIQRAFSLRTLLDDENPETPLQQRQMNTEILQIAHSTAAALEQQQEGFRELRNLSARVDEKLAELRERVQEIDGQLPLAQAKLDNLQLSYSPAALLSLSAYPQQIEQLLAAVRQNITDADALIIKGERAQAVGYAQLAEGTLAKAADLLKRINDAPQILAQAKKELAKNIESLSSDVEDAHRLRKADPAAKADPAISAASAEAQKVLRQAQADSDQDLLSLNTLLQRAEEKLDYALSSVRAREQVLERQRMHASSAQARAQESLRRAETYINDYRAGVNANARTYAARAHEAYQAAENAPIEQQAEAFSLAKDLAERALREAQRSVYHAPGSSGVGAGSHTDQMGNAMNGFLTGMLISSVLNGLGGSSRPMFPTMGNMGGGFNIGGSFGGAGREPGGRIGF